MKHDLRAFPSELLAYFNKVFGEEAHLMIDSLKRPAQRYFIRVNTLKIRKEILLSRLRARGIEAYDYPLLDDAIYLAVKGPFEIPEKGKVVIADKFASESVYVGANLYAPGVLKADPTIRKGDLVIIKSPSGGVIAQGIAMMSGALMKKASQGLAVKVRLSRYYVPSLRELKEYRLGLIYEQSLPAMLVSHVLRPCPDEVVVDMCAAPGGKTTHMAQLMKNQGIIYAFDRSPAKVRKLLENVRRLGVKNVEAFVHDSRYLHVDFPDLKADKVLLDPPCSALGVRPKLYESKGIKDIISCMDYQKQFLRAAFKILKSGGLLAYSTCTLSVEENELVIKYAINNFGMRLVEQSIILGSEGLEIVEHHDRLQRFYPHRHDTPGYFIALLEKP
ncbi:MAG: RsmB/NOP family class I SAM-dependent RNA methyltransferase [Thermoprotei archaeon]|nr:MAG: RsmB/NOP family class I SAM-dependent RNA methyltransferase [Thermoprotei archaeon]RLF23213.1 MAG: RsmB/NOP family class I SAM-dependent RNA methyltransferase [Thermoprotei archaeon]